MAPSYIDYPERPADLRSEVARLLEDDGTRAGEVYRTSVEAMQARKETQTPGSNEEDYILPGLLEGRIAADSVEGRRKAASRLRAWIRGKHLSDALKADFQAQLEAIAAVDAGDKYRVPLPQKAPPAGRPLRRQTAGTST